ncbi:MAG: prohibitin family protein [Oscillospiraceae bacterium]|jgi:regulator of protease activity HflC (stomatin/prohibitin superfamily)|nr:prohibitin family protein [Oscillospiraceae bacterium]
MTWIVLVIIGVVVVYVLTGFTVTRSEAFDRNGNAYTRQSRSWKPRKLQFFALLPVLFIIGSCVTSVPAGHTGVLVTFGKVEGDILTEGVNFKLPYQQVVNIDNRVQREPFQLEAFSSDIQQTDVIGSINFTVDRALSQNLYRNVGVSYYQTVIYPRVLENVKLVFSGFTAEGLIEKRTELAAEISSLMKSDMRNYGIDIVSVNIENIDFTDIFTNAVEAKQVAQQNKLTIQTEQESQNIVAQKEAERQVIQATADAERRKLAADADAYSVRAAASAEAEANQVVAESLTPALLDYTRILQWNGTVPQVQLNGNSGEDGGAVYPVINIPEIPDPNEE